MASMREKKPGVWEVRMYLPDGIALGSNSFDDATPGERVGSRQLSRTFRGTRDQALVFAAKLEEEYAGMTAATTIATVEDAFADWLKSHPEWARLTLRDYESRAEQVCADRAFARLRLDKLRRSHANDVVRRWTAAGVPPSAIHNRVAVIRSAIAHAVFEREVLPNNPIVSWKPKVAKPVRRNDSITDEEAKAILRAAEVHGPIPHLGAYSALHTGARRGELSGLRWDDFDDRVLTIDRQVYVETIKHPDGRLESTRKLEDLKTRRSHRSLEVDDEFVLLWEAGQASQEVPSVYVFGEPGRLADDPRAIPSPDAVYRMWVRAVADAGLEPARLHVARHWSASAGISRGFSVVDVADRLGAAPLTVLHTYAHPTTAARKALATSLGGVFTEGVSPGVE